MKLEWVAATPRRARLDTCPLHASPCMLRRWVPVCTVRLCWYAADVRVVRSLERKAGIVTVKDKHPPLFCD